MTASALDAALVLHGLHVAGAFQISANDALPRKDGSLILISPAEPAFWPIFTASTEYRGGRGISDQLLKWIA
jgi:hypothetical protein